MLAIVCVCVLCVVCCVCVCVSCCVCFCFVSCVVCCFGYVLCMVCGRRLREGGEGDENKKSIYIPEEHVY